MQASHPFSTLRISSLIALTVIALFAIRLSFPSVLHDRGFYLHGAWVLDVVQNSHWICQRNHTGEVTSKPPLYIWLAALATLPVRRISLFSMLRPNAIATPALAWLIWSFGSTAFGQRAGLLGALSYLISYVGATQVALARAERFLCCWFLAGLLLFSLAPHQQERHLFPIIPAAALLAGRELARLVMVMQPRVLLGACVAAVVAGLSIIAASYHLFLDHNERVRRAQGMQELADVIRHRIGEGVPLIHVETPFSLQFFLNMLTPLTTAKHAASLLAGADTAFVAVRDLTELQDHLAEQHVALSVVAQWPATGEAEVWIVSTHPQSEWTDPSREEKHGSNRGNYRGAPGSQTAP